MTIDNTDLTLPSCTVHLLRSGPADGRTIILLHGMKFQAATWRELSTLDLLAAHGWRALAVDMPGFGGSPECAAAQDTVLDELIRQECGSPPVLLGPSMGGRIALEYGIGHPDALSGLILVGPVGVEENRGKLGNITVPTLMIWGSEDQIAPPAHSDILLAEITGARREIIEGAPHPCYLDQPERFHDLVTGFLAGLA